MVKAVFSESSEAYTSCQGLVKICEMYDVINDVQILQRRQAKPSRIVAMDGMNFYQTLPRQEVEELTRAKAACQWI